MRLLDVKALEQFA